MIKDKLVERRKYIRLKTPISLTYTIQDSGNIYNSVTKDISADGLRFEIEAKNLKEASHTPIREVPDAGGKHPASEFVNIELKLEIYDASNPVHAKGRIIWKRRISLEDNAPYDVGVEFTEIEEDNKNTFLKFLCDLIYNLPKETTDA